MLILVLIHVYSFGFLQEDLYYPHPLVQDILWASLHKIFEPILMHWPGKKLREKAVSIAMEHIHYEDENTRYICIGPVNKVGKTFSFYHVHEKFGNVGLVPFLRA